MPRVAEPTHDLMVDIETLGNTANPVIVQIGACFFDRSTGHVSDTFKINIDPQSCVDRGLEMTADTVMFWLKQSKEAQDSITADGQGLYKGLTMFKDWVESIAPNPKKVNVWCHSSFDFPALNNAFKKLRVEPPWMFWSSKDLRTLVDMSKVNIFTIKREGSYHDALDDCLHQVVYAVRCMKALKI